MANETKITIIHKENSSSIGMQMTNTDPVFFTVAGDLTAVVNALPALLPQALAKWHNAPRNPTTAAAPPAPPVTTRPTMPTKPAAPAAGAMDRMI